MMGPYLYGASEMTGDLLGIDGAHMRFCLSVRRGNEGAHLGQNALLIRVHIVVDAVPDGCSVRGRT